MKAVMRVLLLASSAVLLAPACRGRTHAGPPHDGGAEAGRGDTHPPAPDAAVALGEDDPRPLLVPSCTLRPPAPSPGTSATSVLRVHLGADPGQLDPFDETTRLAAQVLVGLVYETALSCVGRDAPETGPGPALVSQFQLGGAGDVITLQVRPQATFHDGKPVSAVDLRASIDAVWRGGARMPQTRAALADLAGMDLLPGNGLRLRLKRPAPILLRALCDVPVAPAGSIAALRRGAVDPIGSGPFRFEDWTRGKRVRLARFPRPGLPPAALGAIHFEIEPDTGRALGRLRRGELDLMPELAEVHFPDQVRPAALGPGLRLLALPGERLTFLAINHHKPPLGERAVRQALSLLWDRAGFGVELHGGLVTPIGAPPFAPQVPVPPFDPKQALELLRAAGLGPPEAKARVTPIRFRLSLLHTGGRNGRAELRRFAERLRRVGIFLELTSVDLAQLGERLHSGQFDLALVSWRGRPFEDPRPRFGRHGPFNFGGFESPRLEALLDELRATDNAGTRPVVDQRLGALLAEELPAIFLYRHTEIAIASVALRGLCNRGGRLDFSAASLQP
jgi:peptide/nickel transport system substrate-binding protein